MSDPFTTPRDRRSFLTPGLGSVTVTYSKSDLVAVLVIAVVVSVWAWIASGALSLLVLAACVAVFFSFYLVGSFVAGIRALAHGMLFDLPLRLLVGYGIVNTALLGLAWLSPMGVVLNFALLLALALLMWVLAGARQQRAGHPSASWVVGICLLATTLWCQDSIAPVSDQGDVVVFNPWIDGFYHAIHIRIFAESHGAESIEDFRMAGVSARLYHYGVYLMPALIRQVSGLHSYAAFAGILAPVGVFFTGLAASAFFGSLWGRWPGLTAAAALMLLPDGSQQGLQNPFMSYHWLTQISPSATYGLALLAVAWSFVIRGCQLGRFAPLLFGWSVAGVLVAYKLHYVVASALLLLLVPALFFRAPWGAWKRMSGALLGGVFYFSCVAVGQRVPGVPVIRFDGSSIAEIMHLVHSFALPGTFNEYVAEHVGRDVAPAWNLLIGVPYVLFTVLGLFLPVLLILLVHLRRRLSLLDTAFPLLLIANFLTMFFGLALDMDSSTPDELSHRPMMIVYFFVVTWIGGTVGLILPRPWRERRRARPAAIVLAGVLMGVPAVFGAGVQRMWVMPNMSPVRLPAALVQVASHMRSHGDTQDIFQDSQFDRGYAIAALAERRPFVSHTLTRMPFRGDVVATRSAAVDRLMRMTQANLVLGTARAFGLRWFVLRRGNKVHWPSEMAEHPVLETDGYELHDLE